MKKLTKTLLTVIASALVALQMGALPAFAQQGSGLRVLPPRQEIRVERGSSDTFEITLVNLSDLPVVAKAFINDFTSDDVSGEPKIIADPSVRSDRSLAEFIENVEDIPMEGNEEKKVTVTVSVPESAPAGAYYGVLRYQPSTDVSEEEGSVQFSLNSSIGVLVLLEVPGDFTESAEIEDITAQTTDVDENGNPVGDPSKGSLFTSTPNQIAIRVKNTGESFVKPFGKVSITNMFGSEVATYELNNTEPRGNVLPETGRTFQDLVDFGGFGRFTITADIAYVQGGEATRYTETFWVIPVWLILVAVALLVLLGFAGFAIYRKVSR